jgi:hypothetical protein
VPGKFFSHKRPEELYPVRPHFAFIPHLKEYQYKKNFSFLKQTEKKKFNPHKWLKRKKGMIIIHKPRA